MDDMAVCLKRIETLLAWRKLECHEHRPDAPVPHPDQHTQEDLHLEIGRFWQIVKKSQVKPRSKRSKVDRVEYAILIKRFYQLITQQRF